MANKLRTVQNTPGLYLFYCPACKCHHQVWTSQHVGDTHPVWKFNGNMEKPTFTPSLLIRIPKANDQIDICHFFITDGKIIYSNDCSHDLVNQTVEMKDEE